MMVYPGDTVLVARAPMIYIMGDVNRPGGYAIATNDARLSMLQAIAMAGSANKTAVQSNVRLIRTTAQGQTELPVHLDAIQKGKQPDITLQPNDIIYVPFSWMRNIAMGSSSIGAATAGAAIYLIPLTACRARFAYRRSQCRAMGYWHVDKSVMHTRSGCYVRLLLASVGVSSAAPLGERDGTLSHPLCWRPHLQESGAGAP